MLSPRRDLLPEEKGGGQAISYPSSVFLCDSQGSGFGLEPILDG